MATKKTSSWIKLEDQTPTKNGTYLVGYYSGDDSKFDIGFWIDGKFFLNKRMVAPKYWKEIESLPKE